MNKKLNLKIIIGLILIIFLSTFINTTSSVNTNGTKTYQDIGGVNYTTITFLSDGTFNWTGGGGLNVSVLIVAGGGAGGNEIGGGGGGGAAIFNNSYVVTGDLNIVVGLGGQGTNTNTQRGLNGGNSSFGTLTAGGGGGGGSNPSTDVVNTSGANGGNGGGAAGSYQSSYHAGGLGLWNGNLGGNGSGLSPYAAGGGAGAGEAGGNGTWGGLVGGKGGDGLLSTIYNGTGLYYGGGGGGSVLSQAGGGPCGAGGAGGGTTGTMTGTGNSASAANGTGGGSGGTQDEPGMGGSGIVIVRYKTSDAESDTTPPAVVFDSQSPADIDSLNVINEPLNITYNISDVSSALNTSAISIYYKHNSTTRNIITFINGTGVSDYENKLFTSNTSNQFLFRLEENEIYPGTYNLDSDVTDDTVHDIQSLSNTNSYIAIEVLNVTNTTQYNFFEIMSNSTSTQRLYYCNSSYSFALSLTSSPNCAQISTISINKIYDHNHTTYSKHQVVDFFINTTTGKTLGGIQVTNKSYFVLRGNNIVANLVNFHTVPNISRTGASRTTTNGGTSWTNQTYTVDAHLHQFSGLSSLYYYVCANDTATPNNQNCTLYNNRTDLYDLGGLPPTSPIFTSPINLSYGINNSLFINYSAAVSPNNYPITKYNITLLNIDNIQNKSIIADNGVALGYIWNTSSELMGQYKIVVEATDNMSQKSYGYSFLFTLTDLTPPAISGLTWKTTGGYATTQLFYNQVLDYVNVTANDNGIVIPVYLTVTDPDNIIIVNNQSMTNETTTLYNYSTNIILNKAGNWTLNATTFDSYGNVNYTSQILNVTLNAQSLRDGWYGYSVEGILNSSEITRLIEYGYDLFELEDNFSTAQTNFANMLESINNSRNVNVKIGLNYILDFNVSNTVLRNQFLSNLTANFTTLNTVPYTDTIVYISLEMVNMSDYTDLEIATALNTIAENITNTIDAEFPIFSKNYTNSSALDGAYISYSPMIYLTPVDDVSFINLQLNLFKTNSSLNRLYVNIIDSVKSVVEIFHKLIIDTLRGLPSTTNLGANYSVLTNNDTIIFNNFSTTQNFTVNVSSLLNVVGKDVWDFTTKKLIELNTDGNITVEVPAYNASIIYFDDFDHIQMDTLTSGVLYKGATSTVGVSNFTNTSWTDLFDLKTGTDIQIELPDPSYIQNQFVTYYGWLNVSVIDTADWNDYDIVILADQNNAELDALNYTGTEFYGYIAVSDYNDSDEWANVKYAEVDAWLALNDSLNIFIDGFDIGLPGANFNTRAKALVDYVQVTKNRKAILNTYTAYQSFATWGKGGVMKESCVNRWNGASASAPTSYTREDWELELNKSKWYDSHNVNVLCQAFDNRSLDGTNLILNYTELQNIYFASKVLGYNYFYVAQPDFQYAHDERIYNVGNNLDRTYHQVTADLNTYYRTYEKGIIYYNTTSGQGWIEDGKTINEMKVCFYVYDPFIGGATFRFNINKRFPTETAGEEYSFDDGWGQGTWSWQCVDTTGETPINGMYLIEGWVNGLTGQGIQLGNSNFANGAGIHSFWDSSSPDAYTAYERDKNWMVNISINQSNRISVDTTPLITQYEINSTIPGRYLNITINSTYAFPIEVWSKPIIVKSFRNISFYNSSQMWVVLNYTNNSNCDSGNPTWTSNTIEAEVFKACIENDAGGTLVRVTAPTLSSRDWQIDEADVTSPTFITIPANASLFYKNESLGVMFTATDDIAFDNFSVNDSRFNINQTGYLINITPMFAGSYELNITINDTTNNINWTNYKVEVKKSLEECSVYFNTTSPITYPMPFKAYTDCSSLYTLYQNGSTIINNSGVVSGAGYYNFTVQRTDVENYTNIFDDEMFTVNKASSVVYTYVNNSRANLTIESGTSIWLNGSLITGTLGSLNLSVNNVQQNYSTTLTSLNKYYIFNTPGVYNVNTSYVGNQNYTYGSERFNVTVVDTISPIITITFPTNTTYNYNTTNITYSVVELNPGYCWYSTNESLSNSSIVVSGINFMSLLFAESFNTWKVWCNDTTGNNGTANISFSLNIPPIYGGAVDTGGGGGGTFGTIPTTLDHVNITWENFYFNNSNYIYVLPLDINENIVNISNITISIISPINFKAGALQKLVDGRWRQSFNIVSGDITEFKVNVFVSQNLKQVEQNVFIPVTKGSNINDIKLTVKEKFNDASDYLKENWILVSVIAVVLLLVIILFSVAISINRRR